MEPKKTPDLYSEAGELLRAETKQKAETLLRLVNEGSGEIWKNTAWNVIGRGELVWPDKLIESLTAHQNKRLADEAQTERIRKYVEQRLEARAII